LNVPLDYEKWIDYIENLINQKSDLLRYMVFTVFDFNDDKAVCQLDMFALMKLYKKNDTGCRDIVVPKTK